MKWAGFTSLPDFSCLQKQRAGLWILLLWPEDPGQGTSGTTGEVTETSDMGAGPGPVSLCGGNSDLTSWLRGKFSQNGIPRMKLWDPGVARLPPILCRHTCAHLPSQILDNSLREGLLYPLQAC